MKFDALHPDATASLTEQYPFEGSFIFKAETPNPCWHCGEETQWIDGCFEAFLCSEECDRAKWNEYFKAVDEIPFL